MSNHDTERSWLTTVLTRDIPLGQAMALEITRLDASGISLSLPLGPNINDKGTAFGGAMASAMILAGWSLPRLLLRREGIDADLVIGRCELRFLSPVDQDFQAHCDWPDPASLTLFLDQLGRRGRGRLDLAPRVTCADKIVASLEARYAALARGRLPDAENA